MEAAPSQQSMADELVDELVPREVDWQRLVRSYPLTSLALAAFGGFVLGRSRGREMVAALSAFAADTLTDNVNEYLGKDVL